MKTFLTALLSLMAVVVSSCAPAPLRPTMQEIQLPPERIVQTGYSFVPLDETGWLIGFRNPEKLLLGKRGSDPDENFIIRSFTQVLPLLKSEEEFMGFAKSVLIMEGAARHKVISQSSKHVIVKGQSCVRTDTLIEDHGAVKRSSRTDPMILEALALLCKHPNKNTAVLVAYSHRYYEGNRDSDSPKKAQKVFDSVEFLDF